MSQPTGNVVRVDDERPPQVAPRHLRRADDPDLCRRRLAREVHGNKRRANPAADARFAVSNRVEADARLSQAEEGTPRPEAFVEPRELEPEQRVLYRAAVRGYLAAFGETAARVVELPFRTALDSVGVELVSSPGIAAELAGGGHELRRITIGSTRDPLLDPVDLHTALLRTEAWAPDDLRIVAVDLVEQRRVDYEPDVAAGRAAAREWADERATRILDLAADGRPRAGRDCQGCAFVAGCSAHAG